MTEIGVKALKMACMQALPGNEFALTKTFSNACIKRKAKFLTLKGFGYYDVLLVYESPNFMPYLTDEGIIGDILNSHVFNCFPYMGCSAESMFSNLNEATFVGVCFLKIHPMAPCQQQEIEIELGAFLRTHLCDSWFALGTLGWNEIVLFLRAEDFQGVVQTLLRLNTNKNDLPLFFNSILKTNSTICVNYKKLPSDLLNLPNNPKVLAKELSKLEGMNRPIGSDIFPTISIIAQPTIYEDIKNYWNNSAYIVEDSIGRYDIVIRPDENTNWSDFLSQLLHFRHEFKSKIHATSTNFTITSTETKRTVQTGKLKAFCGNINNSPIALPKVMVRSSYKDEKQFTIEEAKKGFGENNGRKLAKYAFSLSAALRNPSYGNLFWDMTEYHAFLIAITREKDLHSPDVKQTSEEIFLNAAYCFSRGAAVRHYGIHGLHESLPGDISFVGGGVQRSLLALEHIITQIFNRINSRWCGFLIAEDPKFAHYNDVIVVPFDDLSQPVVWWQIYHEIGHCIEHRYPWIRFSGTEANPIVFHFLQNMHEHREQYQKLLPELVAEVFGFILGFFNDIDLFITKLWTLLNRISTLPTRLDLLSKYVIRSFFVEMFYRRFLAAIPAPEEEYTDQKKVQKLLFAHLEKIEQTGFTLGSDEEKIFFSFYHAPTMSKLYPIAADLFCKIKSMEQKKNFSYAPEKPVNSQYMDEAFTDIKCGRVFYKCVDNPEYLLYRLIKEDEGLSFQSQIAAVLTFWNCGVQSIKREFSSSEKTEILEV